jgi:hypothetical protein
MIFTTNLGISVPAIHYVTCAISITNSQGGFMVTEEHGECRAPLQFQEALAMHTSSSG